MISRNKMIQIMLICLENFRINLDIDINSKQRGLYR